MTDREARRWKRKYRRLALAISRSGGVAKVKMQLPDGRWVYGVFLPYDPSPLKRERLASGLPFTPPLRTLPERRP